MEANSVVSGTLIKSPIVHGTLIQCIIAHLLLKDYNRSYTNTYVIDVVVRVTVCVIVT